MISKRTKAALEAAKARGIELGNPNPIPASQEGIEVWKTKVAQHHERVRPLIQDLQVQGYSLRAIAKELNSRNVPTIRGGLWYATTVRNILNK